MLRFTYAQAILDSVKADTGSRRFMPTGLRIGTDAISLVKTQIQDNFQGYEINADVDIHRYILSFDYGSWRRNLGGDSSRYENDGRYWRAGIDANFLTRDPDRNVFFIGLRYGRSSYSETLSVRPLDTSWGVMDRTYTNTDLKTRWFELAAGLKVKIYKFIWFGYTGSMKFGLKKNEDAEMLSYDVPGYGNVSRENTWGFTYQIFFRIPFRKTVPILPPKKK